MKASRYSVFLLFIIGIAVQYIVIKEAPVDKTELAFATFLMTPDSPDGNTYGILYSIIPFPFIVIWFSGRMEDLISGKGKLFVIRSYSKSRLVLMELVKITLEVFLIVMCMSAIYEFLGESNWQNIGIEEKVKIFVAYYLCMLEIIFFEFAVELKMSSQYGIVISVVVFASEIILSNIITAGGKNMWMNYLFTVNLGFAYRNGILDEGYPRLSGNISILIEVVLVIILCLVSLLSYRKKDII